MKSTKLRITALLLVVVMVFTGCMSSEISVKINKDGSGVATVVMEIEKEALLDIYVSVASEMYGYELPKSMIESEVDKNMQDEGMTLITRDGVDYYQTTETKKVSNSKEMNAEFNSDAGEATGWITGDTFYLKFDMEKAVGGSTGLDAYNVDMSEYQDLINKYADGIKYTIKPEFEEPIVSISSNGKIDEENPNKAIFELTYASDKGASEMFATTNSKVTVASVRADIKKANKVNSTKVKVKAPKVSKKSKKATLKYTIKKAKDVKGYEVQYSLKKNMKSAKTIRTKKLKGTIKKLKQGKKYYVRVRAYKNNYAGIEVYSKWSNKKAVKTKKSKKK